MATRIATVFASLREFPFVRHRAAKYLDPMTMTTFRDLIPTKLAAGISNCLVKYKSIPNFPQKETSHVIHEWTYDAMCHDLLNIERNKYVHEISKEDSSASSVVSSDLNECGSNNTSSEAQKFDKPQKYLLDLYSGCGAMSTGLCIGASLAGPGIKLVTKWVVDINSFACKSLQWNHPETKVRNEAAKKKIEFAEEVGKVMREDLLA